MSTASYLELLKVLHQITHPVLSFLLWSQLCKMNFTYTVSPCLEHLPVSQLLPILSKYFLLLGFDLYIYILYTNTIIFLLCCLCVAVGAEAPLFPRSIHSIDVTWCGGGINYIMCSMYELMHCFIYCFCS